MDFVSLLLGMCFVAAILLGAPLFAIMGGGAVLLFKFITQTNITIPITEICKLANAPGIIALPLFIFSGFLFAESNFSDRLVKLSNASLGWIPGGLAVVTVFTCTIFTAMTGGSAITIVAVGGVLLPSLLGYNYDKSFSLGLVTASGSSGVLFAPSLPIIIYGMVAKVDITELFIAAIIPGVLIVFFLSMYGVFYGVTRKVPSTPFSLTNLLKCIWELKWIIPLPLIVISGIYGGFISVTEAASVTAAYALISECFIYKEIPFNKLMRVIDNSMIMMGALLVVMGCALGVVNFLVDQQVPQSIMETLSNHISSKVVFLLVLNIFLLIVGCIMDIFSAIVVVVPLILPVSNHFGIDPVHLAIIFLTNLEIGYLTPPVGLNLFLASLRFNIQIMRLYRVVIPFLILLIIALLLISYNPNLSLYLLNLTGKRAPILTL